MWCSGYSRLKAKCATEATFRCRYALNWVKLRAWELEDWDALLMLDADTSVVSDVRSLFALPTDFAVVLDEDKTARRSVCNNRNVLPAVVVVVPKCCAFAAYPLKA